MQIRVHRLYAAVGGVACHKAARSMGQGGIMEGKQSNVMDALRSSLEWTQKQTSKKAKDEKVAQTRQREYECEYVLRM